MIGNYWNSAYRNLMKRKGFSFINVFGLAVGMASALLILTYVTFEFSFDKMHLRSTNAFSVWKALSMKAKYRPTIGPAVRLVMVRP